MKELVQVLNGHLGELVVVLLQNRHGGRENWREELVPVLDALPVDVMAILQLLRHSGEIKGLVVAIGKAGIDGEEEDVAGMLLTARQTLRVLDFLNLKLFQGFAFLALATLEMTQGVLVRILGNIVVLMGQTAILAHHLVIVVQALVRAAGVFFAQEVIKALYILRSKVGEAAQRP